MCAPDAAQADSRWSTAVLAVIDRIAEMIAAIERRRDRSPRRTTPR